MAGATEAELRELERAVGFRLPADHRDMLSDRNGWQEWFGGVFVMFYSTTEVREVSDQIDRLPGFVAIASDGSREFIGFDLRQERPPVVMADIASDGWDEALYQAESLTEFMDQRLRGDDLRWDRPYWVP